MTDLQELLEIATREENERIQQTAKNHALSAILNYEQKTSVLDAGDWLEVYHEQEYVRVTTRVSIIMTHEEWAQHQKLNACDDAPPLALADAQDYMP